MTQRSTVAQNFIDGEIGKALSRAGLPHNHSIRSVLDAEAQIGGVRDAAVNCDGQSVDLRIKQLRSDVHYKNTFPVSAEKLSKNDMLSLRSHFQEIAEGTVTVE